ncbi:Hypothetical_protein [Hexamita inflata]|uniref:Hypothetical_protein n=1 Tax=Hexamita inflata TaxID=28002 RepID=A0AA86P6A0_9EUKA|nr:Hypothetical protein HINF_LOCUS19151 [Hexamita inflata]
MSQTDYNPTLDTFPQVSQKLYFVDCSLSAQINKQITDNQNRVTTENDIRTIAQTANGTANTAIGKLVTTDSNVQALSTSLATNINNTNLLVEFNNNTTIPSLQALDTTTKALDVSIKDIYTQIEELQTQITEFKSDIEEQLKTIQDDINNINVGNLEDLPIFKQILKDIQGLYKRSTL